MSRNKVRRRDFLKLMGIGAAGLSAAPTILARTTGGTIISSPDEYGDFPVEKLRTNYYQYKSNTNGK